MSCYKPLKAFRTSTGVSFSELARDDHIGQIELPCGQCIGCRERIASDWALRVAHESTLWPQNCFLTLTYAGGALPYLGGLQHSDFQRFMKRLRKHAGKPIRYYMCGEYGPSTQRPHYHACIFNHDFRSDRVPAGKSRSGMVFYSSAALAALWPHGRATVQDLTPGTASYCARYITSKLTGDLGEATYQRADSDGVFQPIKPPYAAMSLKPGIGARWFERYSRDVFPHDTVVAEGIERPVPKYYTKLLKRSGADTDELEYRRQLRAKRDMEHQTPARLAVRETVHKARIRNLNRESN